MYPSLFKLFQDLLSRFGTTIVGIINDDLTSLNSEEVPNLIFQLIFYPLSQRICRFTPRS